MQKDHLAILLEDISGKFDLVLEGHAALDKKIDDRFEVLDQKIEHNTFMIGALSQKIDAAEEKLSKRINDVEEKLSKRINDVEEKLSKKIDAVAADVAAHRADTEAHHGVYRVKEE